MGELRLFTYEGVKRYKSVRRAIARGHVSDTGIIYPRRPFNNRKNKPFEDIKRSIYGEFRCRQKERL